MNRASMCRALLLTVLCSLAGVGPLRAHAQTRTNVGGLAANQFLDLGRGRWACVTAGRKEPLKGTGVVRPVVASSSQPGRFYGQSITYASYLTNFPGSTVDVVMAQCYGGAFLGNVQTNASKTDWTFASACSWQEPAKSANTFEYGGLTNLYVNNFTRAWREDAQLYTQDGVLRHFMTAVGGRKAAGDIALIPKDPYVWPTNWQFLVGTTFPDKFKYPTVSGVYKGQSGIWAWFGLGRNVGGNVGSGFLQVVPVQGSPGFFALKDKPNVQYKAIAGDGSEHPQYASSSDDADNRTFMTNGSFNQFAVLVVWAAAEPRHAANMARVYRTLVDYYHVPAGNIAVLIGNGTFNGSTNLGPYVLTPGTNGTVTETLDPVPISGSSSILDFSNAISGNLFSTMPGTNDHLLVYNTGHGVTYGDPKSKAPNWSAPNRTWYMSFNFDANAVFVDPVAGLVEAGQDLTNFTDPTVTIQLATIKPISAPDVTVNGVSLQSVAAPLTLVSDPSSVYSSNDIFDFEPVAPGGLTNTYIYQTSLPNSLLESADGQVEIGLVGLDPAYNFDPNFLAAAVIDGGDEEVISTTPDMTTVSQLTLWPYGDYVLLSWPAEATNFVIFSNNDLSEPNNWAPLVSPQSGMPERTGIADAAFPMGTNWALVSITNAPQMFFRLGQP